MCDCFTRVFGVSWSPAASYAAEGRPPERHVFRTTQQSPLAEPKGNEPPALLGASAGTHPHLPLEEAEDADRVAQKEKLHEELKRVLQRKGESQRGPEEGEESEEEEGVPEPPPPAPSEEMESKLSVMEKTIKTSELLEIIVETEAEAGVSGMSVAGGGKEGLYVKDVVKDSPAARALSLQEGDQLLSARVYFDNIKYEDALQLLKCAEPYKVSFCLKRTVPSTDIALKSRASAFKVRGPKAKMAKLNIQSLSPLKKKKKKKVAKILAKEQPEAEKRGGADLAAGKLEIMPVDVEFSLPKFSRLRKAKSAGEVAMAEPSPEASPRPSSLEIKRRKLKFPRLKVKEAAAMAAARAEAPEGRLEVGLPKLKASAKGEGEGKVSRFTAPFVKAKKPQEEAKGKVEVGFQAPQVELDLSLPKVGPEVQPPRASPRGEGFRIQAPHFELPKVETVLPKVSIAEGEVPEGGLQAGLKLPMAEVEAPKVDVDLSLPKWEGPATPELAPKGEGFKVKVPKFGVSVQEAELKLPSGMALEGVLEKGRRKAEELEGKLMSGVTVPSLEVKAPSMEVELPLPKGKADVELPKPKVGVPEVSLKIPSASVTKGREEAEGRLPQVELGFDGTESPKAKAKGPRIQIPGLGISLGEHKMEGKEAASAAAAAATAESKVKFPGVKMPSLDISVPKVGEMELPKAELPVPARKAKSKEAAEAPGFKFQMPQMSLPKFSLPSKAAPSPPQIHAKLPKSEGDLSVKVSVPKVDLFTPAVKLPDVQFPKAPEAPKPELDISVEKPKVEVAVPSTRLSFPRPGVPALDVDLPKVEIGLDLPKVERELAVSEETPRDHEGITLRLPTLETVSKGLGVEVSLPTCHVEQPDGVPSGRSLEAPDVSGMAVRIPKVDLALGKELGADEGEQRAEVDLELKTRPLPKVGLDLEGPAIGAKMKLPSVEIPAVTLQGVAPESSQSLEAEPKRKSPRLALPKFSISGPKIWKAGPEASAPELEGSEAADKGLKLKMPTFGISLPKSKAGAEVEGPQRALAVEAKKPKERLGAVAEVRTEAESSETGMKFPTMDVEMPSISVDISLPKGAAGEESAEEGEAGMEVPDLKLKVPKFSLPKFGGKSKEGEAEPKRPEKEAKAKGSKFKMPSFSMGRKEVEGSGLAAGAKAAKVPGSPKLKHPSVKMPKLALPSSKVEAGPGKLHLSAPELKMKVPQVDLPKISSSISSKEAKAETELVPRSESPSFKVKMPSLEIAVPGPTAEGELVLPKPVVDVSEADIRGYEGELRIPKAPSLGVSLPKVELGVSLPSSSAEEPVAHGGTGADAKIKLPKVELPKFGRGEEGEAEMHLLGRRLSFGREGEQEVDGAGEISLMGTKVRVPRVDLSLPKARLSDAELPLTEGELEGKFKVPSVGLPKFSTPKMKAPDIELDVNLEGGKMPKVKVSGPAIRLPRFGESGSDGEGDAEMDLPRVPQLELKAPKLGGSTEMLSPETGLKEAKIKMPSLPIGFGFGKAEGDAGLGADENKFKMKLPSLSLSKTGSQSSTETQPLCPSAAQGADSSFKMPDVGFSLDQDGQREVKAEAGKLAGVADLVVDVGGLDARLKVPKVKMPTFGVLGPKGEGEATASPQSRRGSDGGDLEGKKAAFKMPGLEISAPSLKAHAEYEVQGAQLWHGGSQDLEGGGQRVRAGSDGRRSPGGKAEAGKKYKMKIPKFGLSLSKEAGEVLPGQEAETKTKKPTFVLGRAKGKEAEGSSGLLEGEGEAERKGMMAKLKMKPSFGLSLSKPKLGAEVNGELEAAPSKPKVPMLGFSKGQEVDGGRAEGLLPNGAQEGRGQMGKIRLPQLELSSPSKTLAESDPELSLKLVRAEDAHGGSSGAFASLKAGRFKSPKITFSGFKKRNGETAPGVVVSSAARTEMALLEAAGGGEKSSGFKFPKVVLAPQSHGVLEVSSQCQGEEGGLKIKLPTVGFSEEEQDPEEASPGPGPGVAKPEVGATAAV
ncbi:periaxin isoform X1 [Pogona vitticeps]